MIIKYVIVERNAICRACRGTIRRDTQCIVMAGIHVSPGYHDLFFHEHCLLDAVDIAKDKKPKTSEER